MSQSIELLFPGNSLDAEMADELGGVRPIVLLQT